MSSSEDKQKRLHHELEHVGLRAQATAVGFLQLCIELRRTKVIDEQAIDRIKSAIADEISVGAPRSFSRQAYRREVQARLDRLFSGEQEVGPAQALAFEEPERP